MCDWTNELSIKFMENYQSQPVLWDPKLRGHKDKAKTNDAWTKISKELNNIPIEELKNKKNSIMATFRGHLRKKKASIRSGAGQNEVYQPIWFLFNQIESFLGNINDCNATINTEQEYNSGIIREIGEDENSNGNETTLSNTLNHENLIEKQTIRENQTSSKPRRRGTSIELDEAGKQMKRAFSTLENCINNRKEEDEYDYYAKILAKKIRKLPENEREVFMYEVDGLYIDFLRRSNNQSSTSRSTTPIFGKNIQSRPPPSCTSTPILGTSIQSRPPSSLASYSEPEIIISSYPQSAEYSISNPSSPAVVQHRTYSNPSSPAVIQHKTYSNPQYSNPLYSEQLSSPSHVTDINLPTNSNIISQAFYIAHENEEY